MNTETVIAAIRAMERATGLRIEINSYDLKYPVSVSDRKGECFGFGRSVAEAIEHRITKQARSSKR